MHIEIAQYRKDSALRAAFGNLRETIYGGNGWEERGTEQFASANEMSDYLLMLDDRGDQLRVVGGCALVTHQSQGYSHLDDTNWDIRLSSRRLAPGEMEISRMIFQCRPVGLSSGYHSPEALLELYAALAEYGQTHGIHNAYAVMREALLRKLQATLGCFQRIPGDIKTRGKTEFLPVHFLIEAFSKAVKRAQQSHKNTRARLLAA